jgi:hypothetical protein
MYDYLCNIENWQVYKVIERGNMIFNMKSNNIVEQTMNFLLDAREMSPYFFIKQTLIDILELINSQRAEVMNSIFTPYANDIIEKSRLGIQQNPYTVITLSASKMLYQLSHTKSNIHHSTTYNLDLLRKTCSCLKWSQEGVPCIHCIQVGIYLKIINEEFYTKYVNKLWFTKTFKEVFNLKSMELIIPDDIAIDSRKAEKEYDNINILTKISKSIISKKRIQSNGDSSSSASISATRAKAAKISCSICGKELARTTKHPASACEKFMNRKQMTSMQLNE